MSFPTSIFLGGKFIWGSLHPDRKKERIAVEDLEKVRVLLPHWIEHNAGHGEEFAKWAVQLDAAGEKDLATLLRQAETALREADSFLRSALEKSGGPLTGHEHHHHHNLPE